MTGRVAVCSRSFSQNALLCEELRSRYSNATLNTRGLALAGDTLVAFLRGHQKAIVGLEILDGKVLAELPELEVVSKYGVGTDTIDMTAMRRYKKHLGWTGGVNRLSVAELTISMMICALRDVMAANLEVRDGRWRQHIGGQLSRRTVGIIGCGNVGKEVVRLLGPFQCEILANDIKDYRDFFTANKITPVSLNELLRRSDVVSVHVPLDNATRGMLSAEHLAMMKRTAVLINTARGGIVDEDALHTALTAGDIAAAGIDVLAVEPPTTNRLLQLSNVLATPHIGGSAVEAILAMGRAAIDGLDHNAIPSIDEFP